MYFTLKMELEATGWHIYSNINDSKAFAFCDKTCLIECCRLSVNGKLQMVTDCIVTNIVIYTIVMMIVIIVMEIVHVSMLITIIKNGV